MVSFEAAPVHYTDLDLRPHRFQSIRVAFTGPLGDLRAWRDRWAADGYTITDLDDRGIDDTGSHGHLFEMRRRVLVAVADESAPVRLRLVA